jgi:broad specificity phosphatase PhoE
VNVFAIRHGETAWSLTGQHTGTTNIPLTDNGRRLAERMRPVLARNAFGLVLCSPMQRARETCELGGFGDRAVIDSDLVEWNYGEYEGLTPEQIHEVAPGWLIFRDGCPGGEAPEQVGARVDRVIARSRAVDGDIALSRTDMCCACSRRAGLGCPRAAASIFYWIRVPCVCSATTARYPLCGYGTGLLSTKSAVAIRKSWRIAR